MNQDYIDIAKKASKDGKIRIYSEDESRIIVFKNGKVIQDLSHDANTHELLKYCWLHLSNTARLCVSRSYVEDFYINDRRIASFVEAHNWHSGADEIAKKNKLMPERAGE